MNSYKALHFQSGKHRKLPFKFKILATNLLWAQSRVLKIVPATQTLKFFMGLRTYSANKELIERVPWETSASINKISIFLAHA